MGSNVGDPGKYVYCVHEADKQEPVSKYIMVVLYYSNLYDIVNHIHMIVLLQLMAV